MTFTARCGWVLFGALCVVALCAFAAARMPPNPDGSRWLGTLIVVYLASIAVAIGWALTPVFERPDGFRYPPFMLAVSGAALILTAASSYLFFVLWLSFGGNL